MELLSRVKGLFPSLQFINSDIFYWSSDENAVYFNSKLLNSGEGVHSLLHETSHGLLHHQSFAYDVELLKMEIEAWTHAKGLLRKFGIEPETERIEQCLNTYRDWIYERSICPCCNQTGIQQSDQSYRCIACLSAWKVPVNQNCRIVKIRQSNLG